ncbi:MAG: hypothetical protein RBU25_20570 [Lentisphaeria bacterium]|jgi:hypothetical protein|nr:hypothetical protein [Lentisphaeria bacterium]
MTRERCKQVGAALLLGSLLLWLGLPFLRATAPTPPGNADLQWYLRTLGRERTVARREAGMAAVIGLVAGAGLALLVVGCRGVRDGRG